VEASISWNDSKKILDDVYMLKVAIMVLVDASRHFVVLGFLSHPFLGSTQQVLGLTMVINLFKFLRFQMAYTKLFTISASGLTVINILGYLIA
jgi:hypothetical protein